MAFFLGQNALGHPLGALLFCGKLLIITAAIRAGPCKRLHSYHNGQIVWVKRCEELECGDSRDIRI